MCIYNVSELQNRKLGIEYKKVLSYIRRYSYTLNNSTNWFINDINKKNSPSNIKTKLIEITYPRQQSTQ